MIDVEVRNFQSIEHAAIQIQGFTALVGRSNIGKSAVVRAVKAALTGAPSTSFVRHSPDCPRKVKSAKTCKCFCSVHLRSETFDLLWEKGDAINRYTFNGKVYDKAERGTPDFLQPIYSLVKIGEDKELLQVADQFDPIFLLNQTGGVVADVLSDVAHLDRVNIATRLSEKDRKEASSTRKVREQDIADLTRRVVLFDGLDTALANVRDIEDQLDSVEAAETKLLNIEKFLERAAALGQHVAALEAVMALQAPDSNPLADVSKNHAQMIRFLTQWTERVTAVQALQAIETVSAPEPDSLRSHAATFEALEGWIAKLRIFKAWLERTKALDASPELAPGKLSESLESYESLERLAVRYQAVTRLMTALTELYEVIEANGSALLPEKLSETSRTFEGLEGLARRYQALTTLVATLTDQYRGIETDGVAIQAEWDALGVCPTCTQPFHAGGHEQRV